MTYDKMKSEIVYDKLFNAEIIDKNISNLFMCTNIFVNCDLCTQWVPLSLLINLIIIIIIIIITFYLMLLEIARVDVEWKSDSISNSTKPNFGNN